MLKRSETLRTNLESWFWASGSALSCADGGESCAPAQVAASKQISIHVRRPKMHTPDYLHRDLIMRIRPRRLVELSDCFQCAVACYPKIKMRRLRRTQGRRSGSTRGGLRKSSDFWDGVPIGLCLF